MVMYPSFHSGPTNWTDSAGVGVGGGGRAGGGGGGVGKKGGDIDEHRRLKFLQAVQHDTVEDVMTHCSHTASIDILLHAIDLECVSVLRELLQAPQFLVS